MFSCPYCEEGNISVEIFGFFVHKLSGRWISCPAKDPTTPFERGIIATGGAKFRYLDAPV